MAERVTTIRLRAEIADLKRQMAEAGLTVKGFGDEAEKASQRSNAALEDLGKKAGLLGAAMVAAAGVAVMAFANFDQSMSNVEAATHESAENMELLREAALVAGADTVFSATEAAGAIEELAKAGISTADILGGGLQGSLDLAAAGGLDVAEAAGIASIALQQFELDGEDVTHVADLLAAGAGKAMGSVSDLGNALRQSGQVANSTGLSIEETTAALSAFASAGLLGSDAGTSFKAMLQRLTPQSAEAQAKMDELGISAYDAQGNFIGLSEFSGNLQESLKDLTPEARNAALATIFGSDAVRAATVLYDEGEQGVRDWIAAVDDQGYAAETAAIRMDNLKGDLEQLSGSVETALIGLGEGANGPLRDLVQGVTELVNKFGELPSGVQGTLLAIVGGGGLVLLGVAGIAKLTIAVSDTISSFKALSTAAKVSGGVAAGALAVGAIALMAWADKAAEARQRTQEFKDTLDELGNTTADTVERINEHLTEDTGGTLDGFLGRNKDSVVELADQFGVALEDIQGYILGEEQAIENVNRSLATYMESHKGSDELVDFVVAINEEAAALTDAERAAAEKIRADEAAGIAQDDLEEDYKAVTEAIDAQIPSLEALIEAQREAAGVVLSERDAQRQFQEAIDAVTEALATNGAGLDINTEQGRANQSALDDIAASGWDLIESMRQNGATQDELQGSMATTRQAFLDAAGAMGMGADEANRLADEMGLIPAKVSVPVEVDTDAATRKLEALRALLALPGVVITADMRGDGGYYANRAEGGIVYGPGTSTSDSIPARLSTGEYVVKASAVAQYGKSFFDGLNAQRFATGGYVGGGSSGGATVAAGMNVTVGNITAADPREAMQALKSELSWEMAGVPK